MGMSPSCHCICPGPGGVGSSSGVIIPTNGACSQCLNAITPLRYTVTYSPSTYCSGSWSNTEYAGPFTCHFVSSTFGVCTWATTEKELHVDTGLEPTGANARGSLTLDSTLGFTFYLRWQGVKEDPTECVIATPKSYQAQACSWRTGPGIYTPKPNCLTSRTLSIFQYNVSISSWHIGFRGLRHKTSDPSPLPASVLIEAAP